jgi:subtilisin-like proprotein convertase family protein
MSKKFYIVLLLLLLAVALIPRTGVNAEYAIQVVRYSENFDSVTAPALPAGWSVAATGVGAGFVTTTNLPDTAPNAAFSPAPSTTSSASITSVPFLVTGATTLLNFRHKYAMEATWDGGVLEISIADGPFQDIIDAGAVFVAGGYTTDLNPSTNPLGARRAWSGATQDGYQSVSVRLPESAFGKMVRMRWRIGTNDSFGVDGWWIDSITIDSVPTGSNSNPVAINAIGNANPYPSEIQVSGQAGFVTGISVALENLTHASPDDIDILLVAPNGRKIVLMSDAGGSNAVSDVDLAFADSASGSLPDDTSIVSGLFKPTNFDTVDVFPPPAPQTALSGSTLGAFYGVNPNGTWQLFVVDDTGANAGAIGGGWSIDIKTSVNACLFTLLPPAQSFTAAGGSGLFEVNIPTGCGWTTSTSSGFVSITSPTAGESTGNVTFTVAPNTLGARTGIITVSDGISSRTFQAQQGSGCPTSIATSTLNVVSSGGPASIAVSAASGCIWNASTAANWITITSLQQSGNGTAAFSVASNPSRDSRSATISIGARTVTVNQAGASSTAFDFDGDGRSDISVYRNGVWYLQQSAAGTVSPQFGIAGDRLAPADFDSDGKTDLAVFRNGVWYVLRSSDSQVTIVSFGLAGDVPSPADYDGDGRAEICVFRSGIWYFLNLATNSVSSFQFGLAGDKPVVADYDGDGKADVAVFRNGTWYVLRSALGFVSAQFGLSADRPVPADYNGDGRADIAVYRNGEWHVLTDFQNYSVANFGLAGDVPVVADYDGDGKADRSVYRAGVWYLLRSTQGFAATQFGLATDIAVPGVY